jgi:hypothetical protein
MLTFFHFATSQRNLQLAFFFFFTMRFTSTLATTALLLCSAAAFSPSNKNANNNRANLEAQSTLAAPGFVGAAPSFVPEPKMKSPTVQRPKWIVSSSGTKKQTPPAAPKAMAATTVARPGLGQEEALAKKKFIAEKHQWEVAKQQEVQSRVSILRERNAARLAQERGGRSP